MRADERCASGITPCCYLSIRCLPSSRRFISATHLPGPPIRRRAFRSVRRPRQYRHEQYHSSDRGKAARDEQENDATVHFLRRSKIWPLVIKFDLHAHGT